MGSVLFQGELLAEFMKDKVPKFLDTLEKQITEAGKGGFAVGSSVRFFSKASHSKLHSFSPQTVRVAAVCHLIFRR